MVPVKFVPGGTVKAVCLTQKMPLDPFFLRAKDLRASTQSILQCFQGLINSFYNSILLCQFKPTLISDLRSDIASSYSGCSAEPH